MKPLRLGMIGGGPGSFIGPVHRIAARLDGDFDLVAGAFSADLGRSREVGDELGIAPDRIYADWRDMIATEARRDSGRIDAIAVTTPNHLHADPSIAALEAGFHVICDKPLASTMADARRIVETVARSNKVFALTHNYTGYPMVRHAKALVGEGLIGALRLVEVEYPQSWLSEPLETRGNRQAEWRTDPARAGAGGALGDIGTHAYHLAGFVTGEQPSALLADLAAFGADRQLDDNAHVLLRYASGARGMLWASQIATGSVNGLRLRVFGSRAGLEWLQEQPNQLRFAPIDGPAQILERGGPGVVAANYVTRIPAGHPEGFLEGFGQLYADFADLVRARVPNRVPSKLATLLPGIEDGLEGMRFIAAAVASSERDGIWIAREQWQDINRL